MPVIAVVNGPNLNRLGRRETDIYGVVTLEEVKERLAGMAGELGLELEFFQSNHEGAVIDYLQGLSADVKGLIINPGALTHYGYSLRDALASLEIKVVEVHITNIHAREEWRSTSLITPVVNGVIGGLGTMGYELALRALAASTEEED